MKKALLPFSRSDNAVIVTINPVFALIYGVSVIEIHLLPDFGYQKGRQALL